MCEVNDSYYREQAYEKYKDFTIEQLEHALDMVHLTGSNGKGQTATVPLIIIGVINELLIQKSNDYV